MAKYADATAATVRVMRTGADAIIEVADNGRGAADTDSGLRGLTDRVDALGRFRVSSPPDGGTVVTTEPPLPP